MVDWAAHITTIATGFGTVLGVLMLLWAGCVLIGRAFTLCATTGSDTSAPGSTPEGEGGIPEAHIAAISAAVAAVVDGPHRVVQITAPSHRLPGWSLEGRFDNSGTYRMPWDRWPRVTARSQRRKNK